MLIFFFKQKTAYEMRISDWSSDVCSSDLPREQTVKHVHVNEGGQAVVADHFHQHTGDRENGKSVKQSDATGAAGTIAALPSSDPLGNGEIGRASCRERVCQYV